MTRPSVRTVPANAPIEEILEILHEDGVIVLSDFADTQATEAEVEALNAKALPQFDRQEDEGLVQHKIKGFRASNTTVFYDLIGKVPEDTCKLLQRKVWHKVMEEFLSHHTWDWYGDQKYERKSSYWLHTSIAYKVAPGAGNQMLHRDQNSSMIQRTGPESLINMVSTFVAGCDVTARNGGTHVIPGSHKWPQDRAPTQEECAIVEMKKGSLAIWLGQIFHGAGANVCDPSDPDALRIIYGLFACFRSGESTTLACKPEEYMKMPPEVLRLLGFYKGSSGAGGLGGKDPLETWEGLKGYSGGTWHYKEPQLNT